ncbi:MAG: hypothetical protein ABI999_12850 [Acidobacteriota bacterium]
MSRITISLLTQRCVALSAAVLIFAISSFAQTTPTKISVADAKKLSLGTQVALEGTVTVASGTFRSSFNDYGFQLQDKTSGMYITIKTDPHLIVGQKVRLTGKLTQTALKFQIVETDEVRLKILDGTSAPKPISIATGGIGEDKIGKLIKITATVAAPVVEVAPYGFRVPVDDGTGEIIAYISTSTGIAAKDLAPGQKLELTGVAGQFNQHYQIYPRSPADIKLISR